MQGQATGAASDENAQGTDSFSIRTETLSPSGHTIGFPIPAGRT